MQLVAASRGDLPPEHGCAAAWLDRGFARFSSIDHLVPART
jgi:hypothetical protein